MIRIQSSYFVAGVELYEGEAVKTAPIVKYMKGWNTQRIFNYCKKKGWKYERI